MDDIDKKIKELWHGVRKQDSGKERESCLADTVLSHYIDGALEEAAREKVEFHLAECNSCLDLVLLHKKLTQDEAIETASHVPEILLQKAKSLVPEKQTQVDIFDIVLKFAKETIDIIKNPGNLAISYSAAPVPVRGEKQSIPTNLVTLSKTVNDLMCDIEVEKVGDGHVNIKIFTKMVKSGKPPEKLRISLFNPHQEIASNFAENGEAHFEGLMFGEYVIQINKQGKKIGQVGFVVC
jgi:hypothetical protein